MFSLTLPTSDKSYLSSLKNIFWNKKLLASNVGGSPGLKILKISKRASSRELFLSDTRELITPKLPVAWLALITENWLIDNSSSLLKNSSLNNVPASA